METSRTLLLSYLWWAWGRRTERDARTGRTCCRRAQRRGRTGRWGRSRALAHDTDSVRGARTPSAAFSSCMARARRRREGAAQATVLRRGEGVITTLYKQTDLVHTQQQSKPSPRPRANCYRGSIRRENIPDADVSITFCSADIFNFFRSQAKHKICKSSNE